MFKTHILLNDRGSNKKTFHLEIEPDGLLNYEPGDSLKIIPKNSEDLVEEILKLVNLSPHLPFLWKEDLLDLKTVLLSKACIIYLSKRMVSEYSTRTGYNIPEIRMDLLDLLKIYPPPGQELFLECIAKLDPITPRLYSISSSPAAHPDSVHITVALDQFEVGGSKKNGHCSSFLSELKKGASLPISIHTNLSFRLPKPDRDIIMMGPGTGIAPFRSFLFEREAQLATGKNWLFYGDQFSQTDFLYQTEIQDFISSGLIQKINLAFSRDQPEKVYIWHEMKKEAATLMDWIDKGAVLYVCGARHPMSEDVERTLLEIISNQRGLNSLKSREYLETLKEEGQYLKDVY